MSERRLYSVVAEVCALIEQWVEEDGPGGAEAGGQRRDADDASLDRRGGSQQGAGMDHRLGTPALPACCRAELDGDLGPGVTLAASVAEETGAKLAKVAYAAREG